MPTLSTACDWRVVGGNGELLHNSGAPSAFPWSLLLLYLHRYNLMSMLLRSLLSDICERLIRVEYFHQKAYHRKTSVHLVRECVKSHITTDYLQFHFPYPKVNLMRHWSKSQTYKLDIEQKVILMLASIEAGPHIPQYCIHNLSAARTWTSYIFSYIS